MSQLIKRWEYQQGEEARWVELYADKILICAWKSPLTMAFGDFLLDSSLFYKISPALFNEILLLMVQQSQPVQLNEQQQRAWLFWQSIDPSQIVPMDCPLDSYAEFVLDSQGAFIQSIQPRGQYIRAFVPLHLFYFFCVGDAALSVDLRLAAWKNIENAFVKNANLLKQHRCILLDYNKIKTQTWNVHTDDNYNEGIFLSVNKYISAGGFSGKDGGGSYETFEWFWYNHAISTVNGNWKDKIPLILANLEQAIK